MSSSRSSASDCKTSEPLPHPDSFAQDLVRELRAAVDAFQADHRGRDALAAVAKAFKRAASVLDHCAPPPGQHEFTLGDRVILCNLQNRADLNNCAAVVKCKSDPVDGDGRVEVSVGSGSRREMLRIKPSNLRLEWHLAAETHVSQTGSRVQVRQLDSPLHGQICQVISSDPSTRTVSVQQEKMYLQKMSPGTTVAIADVAASGLVPAVYIIIAKEVQNQAETVAVHAAGVPATPAISAVMNAAHSCAEFYIRCARGEEASKACVRVMDALRSGGQASTTPSSRQQDHYERLAWISSFLKVCLHHVDPKLQKGCWYNAATTLLMLCKVVISSIQGSDSYNFFVLLNNLAGLLMKQNRLDESEAMYKEALRIRELNFHPMAGLRSQTEMVESYDVSIAATMHNLAMVHIHQKRLTDAEVLYKEALRTQQAKLGHESLDVATTLHNLAVLHDKQQRFADAEATYSEALRIRELNLGHESLKVADTMVCLAMLHVKQARHADAEAMFQEALRIQHLKLGRDSMDSSIADSLNNIALLYTEQLRLKEAEGLYTQALRIYKLSTGHDSLHVAAVISNLAGCLGKNGQLQEAEAMYKEALRIKELHCGHESLDVAAELSNTAAAVCDLGRWVEGESLHKEALRIRESLLGRESVEVGASLKQLACLYALKDRAEEAEALYQEALRISELKLGPHDPSTVELRHRLKEIHPPPLSDI